MPRDASRNEMLNCLSMTDVMGGVPVQGASALFEQSHDTMLAIGAQAQRAVRLAQVIARTQFHLGLVRLLNDHPEVETVSIGEQHLIRKGNLGKIVALEFNDHLDGLNPKERTRAEKRLAAVRQAFPFNGMDKSIVSMLFTPMHGEEKFRLTRNTVRPYLAMVLGDDLYAPWLALHEQQVLRADVGKATDGAPPVRERPRL